ncbi:hypothetical protein B0H67DRAFT_645953 [Lasiosphaeris hirsuta]|uniref:Uncharacterized protein n=1 Tax=Lasiosphaeris hirsuta TaxID=260670 RepID=A0AA40DUR8_9PEZI|nr:hypothetical protein B0H67DRAFT_645953 [Lasiosphaeris hirsuta]
MISATSAGVIIDADASIVRVTLRFLVTAVLIAVAFLGDTIMSMRPKVLLARNKDVPILSTTGWLSAFDAVRTLWVTRSSPLCLRGVFAYMILTGALRIVSDLATSGLVNPIDMPGTCALNTTGTYWLVPRRDGPDSSMAGIIGFYTIPFEERARVAASAFEANAANGGVPGIYRSVDGDARVRYQAQDTLGSWRCVDRGVAGTYNFSLDLLDICNDLAAKGFITLPEPASEDRQRAPVTILRVDSGVLANGSTAYAEREIGIYSTNETTDAAGDLVTWDLNLMLHILRNASDIFEDRTLHHFQCRLDAPGVQWLLTKGDPQTIMDQWGVLIHNLIYRGASRNRWLAPNVTAQVESGLNLMTTAMGMAYGENGTALFRTAANIDSAGTPLPAVPPKGCLIKKTIVPWAVVLLLGLVVAMMLGVVVSVLIAWLAVRKISNGLSRPDGGDRGSMPHIPIGLIGWIKFAVTRGTENDGREDARMLKVWSFTGPKVKGTRGYVAEGDRV